MPGRMGRRRALDGRDAGAAAPDGPTRRASRGQGAQEQAGHV